MPPLDDDDDTLQLSSDSSAGSSPVIPKLAIHDADDISKDLAELEELRRNVQKNLRLRPIRSRGCLPKIDLDELGLRMPGAFPLSAALQTSFDIDSPAVSTPDSAKHTVTTPAITPTAKSKTKGPPPPLAINAHAGPSRSTVSDGQEIHIPPLLNTTMSPLSATSPTSSIVSSYFTPAGETPVTSRFGMFKGYDNREAIIEEEESSADRRWHLGSVTNSASAIEPRDGEMTMVSSPIDATFDFTGVSGSTLTDIRPQPQPIPASELYTRLSPLHHPSSLKRNAARGRPILIDTRAPAVHAAYRIRGSMNVAIPSLILKRCRKITASGILRGEAVAAANTNSLGLGGGVAKAGFQSLDALRQFVVGEKAKAEWNVMLQSRSSDGLETEEGLRWDGDIIVFDEEMEQDIGGTAWILMEVLKPLVNDKGGRVDYLEGGIMKGVKDTELESLIEFGPIRGSHTNGTIGDDPSLSIGAKRSATGGLFKLDISKRIPEIETSNSSISSTSTSRSTSTSTSLSSTPASPGPLSIPRSPMSIIPPSLATSHDNDQNTLSMTDTNTNMKQENLKTTITKTIPPPLLSGSFNLQLDASPSPPPSYITFRPQGSPPNNGNAVGGLRAKRPSVPNLRRIDTKSAERLNPNLPKLSVRTKPIRSATLTIPPRLTLPGSLTSSFGLPPPTSPSHLDLMYSSHSPPASAIFNGSFSAAGASGSGTTYHTPPHTPGTPKAFATFQAAGSFGPPSAHPDSRGGSHSQFFGFGSRPEYPPSPATARPDPPSAESEALPVFSISTILPNFLFLGPELTEPNHVEELRELGVRRILNIAIECNEDDHGLMLKSRFEKYVKIPMRDTVEEENILRGVREVCDILDDARLHSAATYVHCKAGKSRSVTAVIAYLIHANHWTLSRAYHFVVERRKGVSPNIGFVSELMNFEEQELGGKSTGVQHGSDNGEGGGNEEMSFAGMGMGGLRRGAHIRESLPPMESFSTSAGVENQVHGGPMSAGGIQVHKAVVGDHAQETEVKDANGRYRHVRRAPVDETTLQPLRRVSKAGLESSVFEQRDG